jgi:chromosome segregation ATPase
MDLLRSKDTLIADLNRKLQEQIELTQLAKQKHMGTDTHTNTSFNKQESRIGELEELVTNLEGKLRDEKQNHQSTQWALEEAKRNYQWLESKFLQLEEARSQKDVSQKELDSLRVRCLDQSEQIEVLVSELSNLRDLSELNAPSIQKVDQEASKNMVSGL